MKLKTGGGFLETCGLKGHDVTDCVEHFFCCQKKPFSAEQERCKIKVIAHFKS